MSHSFDIFADISGRYSHSLYGVSSEAGVLDVVSDDISRLDALLAESSDFSFFIHNPVFSMKDRQLVVDDLVKTTNFCVVTENFLRVLISNGRLSILPAIIKSFRVVCMYYRNQVMAYVRTFSCLSLQQQNQLRDCLEKMVGQSVILDIVKDFRLMGGFIVEIGSYQIDASLHTKLVKLGFMLKEVD
ncbi:ATP synthase F1 subunit delta [Candidatus Liberibacter africanus]|uniref:ATP synthase subunit delta n=1 Tax=Candidatus Liberibacter africanus PTSAPSY TaxID=1277257 RepID=A0A0G3I324_LIBAF|nr:ATP synthase F1 subunit delta [Candidatus Liberibacter africanus]AKK20289.1 F0F1 ATP synthase subunit delta [Candidatus Liberibacter africanus PTSAPSY]QTP64048.1 ATP synthase F1 subunit delta [Candidatus Liberibacter africanus]